MHVDTVEHARLFFRELSSLLREFKLHVQPFLVVPAV